MHVDLEALVTHSPEETRQMFQQDRPYLAAFCQKYGVELVDFSLNIEDFPPKGLMYYFTDNLGGYSIEGIKAGLDPEPKIRR